MIGVAVGGVPSEWSTDDNHIQETWLLRSELLNNVREKHKKYTLSFYKLA